MFYTSLMSFYFKTEQWLKGKTFLLLVFPMCTYAQTNPTAQSIPYAQDFGLSYFNVLPTGFAAWNTSPSPCGSVATAATSTAISDQTVDTAQVTKINGDLYGYSGLSGGIPNNDGGVYIQTSSHATQGTCQLVLAVNTTGYSLITVAYDVEMVNPQPKPIGLVFQFRVGTAGAWTTVNNIYVHSSATRVQYQTDNFNLAIGAAVDNQAVVQFRWATSRGTTPAGNSSGITIDNILVNGSPGAFSPLYYRSIATGNWSDPAIWESSSNNITWSPAIRAPGSADNIVTIRSPHVISTAGLASLVVDDVIIDAGATLWNASGTGFVVNDGPAAVDLDVNGTFEDSSVTSVVWVNSARWRLGPGATLVKATNSGSRSWQTQYYNGIASIPASSNWICRKPALSTIEPTLSSTNNGPPNPQAHYGNLYIENYSASWNPLSNCRFNGSSNFPVIKGNWYIGGNGTGTVTFSNTNANASPVLVLGDIIIKGSSQLQSQGTGIELHGNLINNGLLSYIPSASKLIFSGGNAQTVSGGGSMILYDMVVSKAGGQVTLNQGTLIDGTLSLINGIVNTSAAFPVVVNDNALVTGASNASFVSGPLTKRGDDSFVFPIGKSTDYQSLAISTGPAKIPFWTETFTNGCASGCLATAYASPNGAWTQALLGTNGNTANIWYISGKECGNNAGSCQNVCAGDASLHMGSGVSTVLDSGAAYSFGNPGPLINVQTNKRIQSPVINCANKYNIIVEFNYLENGSGTVDNAMLVYFDGVAWTSIVDLNKTIQGACPGGSTWTKFRVNLPASSNNNANVRIGFSWSNDADGIGANPSFAVDDITLTDQSDAFTAEYFNTDPQLVYGGAVTPPLNHVSHCEYWILTRNFGSASKNVTLSFDANSCGVTNLANLRVARYSPANWYDEGNTMTTGTIAAGTVTGNQSTAFGPFTLSSTTTDNPLPVTLLDFNALYDGKDVQLTWTTAHEVNNDYFTVQRSDNGYIFEDLFEIDGAGTSHKTLDYFTIDKNPLPGISYYRLMQTDFNGKSSHSKIVAVEINPGKFDILSIKHLGEGNGMETVVTFPGRGTAQIAVSDMLGRIVYNDPVRVEPGPNLFNFGARGLNQGVYFIQVFFNDRILVKKFLF